VTAQWFLRDKLVQTIHLCQAEEANKHHKLNQIRRNVVIDLL